VKVRQRQNPTAEQMPRGTGAPTLTAFDEGEAALVLRPNETTETNAKIPTSATFLNMIFPPI
jgi:hypothetical protein